MNRRQFIRDSACAVTALAGTPLSAAAGEKPRRDDDVITLGRSKLLVSRQGLGLGDGTAQSYRKMGQSGFAKLIRHALDNGVRYFDLLPGPAHEMLAEALRGIPRDRYTLITNFRHPQEQDPAKMIERFRQELKTDYLDAVLAGAILTKEWATEAKWAERRDLLSSAKQAGKVKAHGVSVHGWEALKSIATDPWVEIALVSCNHKGAWMDAPAGRQLTELERRDLSIPLIRAAHEAGIGIAGMKIFSHSGYRDASNPAAERLKAIGYVLSLGSIDTLPIMCESTEEMDEVRSMIKQVGAAA